MEKDLPDSAPKQLRHVTDLSGETADGLPVWVFRLRGLGMFHDPNDLVLAGGGDGHHFAVLPDGSRVARCAFLLAGCRWG
ncbi:MAG: hypothetical protein QM757_10040 [Paludibaculum sp.]